MKTVSPLRVSRRQGTARQPVIAANPWLVTHRIPDETPRCFGGARSPDKTALLSRVRSNRLISLFLGLAAQSFECNLRTTVAGIGPVEIDEVYWGMDWRGRQYVVPVQAKGGNDKLSAVQARQDIVCCAEKFPGLICRAISAQFMDGDLIALFELTLQDGAIKVVNETHYRLVPAEQISREELLSYARRSA